MNASLKNLVPYKNILGLYNDDFNNIQAQTITVNQLNAVNETVDNLTVQEQLFVNGETILNEATGITQDPGTDNNTLATTAFVQQAIVDPAQIFDTNNIWTGTNTFQGNVTITAATQVQAASTFTQQATFEQDINLNNSDINNVGTLTSTVQINGAEAAFTGAVTGLSLNAGTAAGQFNANATGLFYGSTTTGQTQITPTGQITVNYNQDVILQGGALRLRFYPDSGITVTQSLTNNQYSMKMFNEQSGAQDDILEAYARTDTDPALFTIVPSAILQGGATAQQPITLPPQTFPDDNAGDANYAATIGYVNAAAQGGGGTSLLGLDNDWTGTNTYTQDVILPLQNTIPDDLQTAVTYGLTSNLYRTYTALYICLNGNQVFYSANPATTPFELQTPITYENYTNCYPLTSIYYPTEDFTIILTMATTISPNPEVQFILPAATSSDPNQIIYFSNQTNSSVEGSDGAVVNLICQEATFLGIADGNKVLPIQINYIYTFMSEYLYTCDTDGSTILNVTGWAPSVGVDKISGSSG